MDDSLYDEMIAGQKEKSQCCSFRAFINFPIFAPPVSYSFHNRSPVVGQ